jgi:hypothetical protein
MKKLFCMVLVVILNLSMVPLPLRGQQRGTMIAGMVGTLQGQPVPGVRIVVKDPAARVVSEAVTDARGRYTLANLVPHRYQLTLDPLQSPYKGQTVVSAVGDEGLTVNWTVSQANAALAMATPGAGQPSSSPPPPGVPATGALIFLGGAGLIAGVLGGTGVFGADRNDARTGGVVASPGF